MLEVTLVHILLPSPCWGCLSQHMGLVVPRCDTACRRRISYSQAVRAGDYFIFKLKFLLYGHVVYTLIG